MPTMRCATVAFMLSSFALSILSSGGAGGVTCAVNSDTI